MTTTTATKTTARKPATRKTTTTGAGRKTTTTGTGPKPADPKPTGAKAELVTECEKCGFKFPKPQTRKTCRVPAACDKRAAKRAEAAAAA